MPYNPEFTSSIRKATKKLNERQRMGLADTSEKWVLKSSIGEYAKSFEAFRSGMSFDEYFDRRRERGDSNVTLDLASDGSVLLELDHDGALAVGLSDPRTDERAMQEYRNANVEVVVGSLLQQRTWKAMDDWLKIQGKGSFDIVFYRPLGGVEYIGTKPSEVEEGLNRFDQSVSYALLKRLYPRLSKKDGEIFAVLDAKELLPESLRVSLRAWVDTLNTIPGIEARIDEDVNVYDQVVFWMRKTKDAPTILPEADF